MKILFATAHPALPQMMGGMQSSGNELMLSLKGRGHDVTFLCGLLGGGYIGKRARLMIKLLKRKAVCDMVLGYPVWRTWFPWQSIEWVANRVKPDAIVIMAGQPAKMALAAKPTGIPLVMNLQNVEFNDHGGAFEELGKVACVANSQFTAGRYRQTYGVEPRVIHPLVNGSKYETPTTRENVTFINPHPLKGVDLALAVAKACPEIPFSFIETWAMNAQERGALEAEMKDAPNITLHPPVRDMRQIYSKCKILIAPSRWEEAYGRVASEPQFSGIPVVASDRGGLPEAVGPGGVLLDPDGPVQRWVDAVKRLWHDEAYYNELSAAAHAYSRRPALQWDAQVTAWEEVIEGAVRG